MATTSTHLRERTRLDLIRRQVEAYAKVRPNLLEERPTWTNSLDSRDTVRAEDGREHTSDQATIWRWREHFQHDFAARMDWCVASAFARANHNPRPVLNGDDSKEALRLNVRPGETRSPLGRGDRGPRRPGRLSLLVRLPRGGDVPGRGRPGGRPRHRNELRRAGREEDPATIHVVLEASDSGSPPLWAYRRAVVTVRP